MRYWRAYLALALLLGAYLTGGRPAWICCGLAALCIVWFLWYERRIKRIRESFKNINPDWDPNYLQLSFDVAKTDVIDEEGDRQAALHRFFERSEEFTGDIAVEIRAYTPPGVTAVEADDAIERSEEELAALLEAKNEYGVYVNGTRVGDVPGEHRAFMRKNLRLYELANKIMLTGWEDNGGQGPLGLYLKLRFTKVEYVSPMLATGDNQMLTPKSLKNANLLK
ncbi:MAG: hypothetical protein Q4B96_04485 [Bacillota bacterium]|nr:hypothetical protein [Bacillota bacterium]